MTLSPYLDIDKKIVSEIYTSSEVMDNLQTLCDVYGSRFPGTPGDQGSVKYMKDKFEEYNVDDVFIEKYNIPGWKRGPATLEVISPVKKELDVICLPGTVSGEKETKLIDLGSGHIDVYHKRKDEINGNVVLVSSATPLGMKRNLHRSEKYNRSILSGAIGFIYMNRTPGYGPITGGMTPIVPAIGIGFEGGLYLQRIVKRYGDVTVRIKTEGMNLDVETYNVVAEIKGKLDSNEYALTGSHYDGHDISQGAYDPASGAVTVMEMARTISMVKDKLKRNLKFVLFGAEETGLWGSNYYVKTHESELDDCRFMLNLDSAGGPGRKGFILNDVPDMNRLIEGWADEMKTELPYIHRVSPYSDHWPFFKKGVPTASGADPAVSLVTPYGHTKYDTLDKINLVDLRLASVNYARFMFRVVNLDRWDVSRKSHSEIMEFIQQQGYDETVVLTDKLKEYVNKWDDLHLDTEAWIKRGSAW